VRAERQARLRRLSASLYLAPEDLPVEAFCAMLAARGLGGIGLTARAVGAMRPAALAALLRRHDLVATSLNSAGYVLHADPAAARQQAELDARLFEAAAELGAPVNLILGGTLHGGAAGRPMPLAEARARAVEGLDRLLDRAARLGVRLSLEPMHPAAVGTRSVVNQLSVARALLAARPALGLTLDLYHSWWDADLPGVVAEEVARLFVVQVCGLEVPADGRAPRRAELSAGPPELRWLVNALAAAGHEGLLEYEAFHDQLGSPDPAALLDRAAADVLALAA
jgi:sugar phosphate isomerase/epimerase